MTTITTNTSARHKPIMGKLTKYRNARRFHAGDSRGSSRPVTELITKGPLHDKRTEKKRKCGHFLDFIWVHSKDRTRSRAGSQASTTLYNGRGGSNRSGGVDNVPHRKANSTE